MYPDRSDEEIYKMTCQFVAPVKVAGHPTGGAIDLTLLKDGKEQDMGTAYNAVPLEPENRTYLYSDYISDEAKQPEDIDRHYGKGRICKLSYGMVALVLRRLLLGLFKPVRCNLFSD